MSTPARSLARICCALAFSAAALALAGCAFRVDMVPARLETAGPPGAIIRIEEPAKIKLSTAYERVLAAGSRWQQVGTLPQGAVYKPVGTVFTIEGRDVHEAYLVIGNGMLQGFFLPAESQFSPLATPIRLSTGGSQ